MRGGQSARPAQFELMISFMERHGDIQCKSNGLRTRGRLENLQKWIELCDLLNDKSLGDPKPIDKWRKCWSDFKNNTKKKLRKLKNKEVRTDLTDLERRLLVLIERNRSDKRKSSVSDDDDVNDGVLKTEIEPDQCDRTSSPSRYFQDIDCRPLPQRKSSASSNDSTSSDSTQTPVKRKKRFKDSVEDMTDKYLEFEREREKMAHEREMARIRQNDKFVTIFGRIVNVLETLAPSLQRYLDRDTNDDR